MRLCHITPSLEERHGGPSKSVRALAGALADIGHEVDLLATEPGSGSASDVGRLHQESFHRDWPQQICRSTGLRRRLESVDAAIIHSHALWLRPLHYAHQRAVAGGAKLVISPRGMMSPWAWNHHRARKRFAGALIHPGAFAAAAGWHATSPAEADDIRRLGFRQPVCLAPNGVTLPPAEALIGAGAAWRAHCPATANRPVALFYSRFHRKKRLRELFNLWIAASRGDWLLLIAGVPEEYSVAEVQGWINAAGATDRVAVADGAGLPPPYAVASLFLLPSHSENFGLVIAEAMAAGVPAVVTDGTPWAGLNTDGRGWCVPWPDFNRALQTALDESPSRLTERGLRARTWVLSEYSWEKSARALAEFYRQLQEARP